MPENENWGNKFEKKGNPERWTPWPRPDMHKFGDRKMEMKAQYKQENIHITSRQGGWTCERLQECFKDKRDNTCQNHARHPFYDPLEKQ